MNGVATWMGIDMNLLPEPRAKRWTRLSPPLEVAFTEEEALEFYRPLVSQDKIEPCGGQRTISVNRYLNYRVNVTAYLRWLQPQSLLAIRNIFFVKKLSPQPKRLGIRPLPTQVDTLLTMDYTWFFRRARRFGVYRWEQYNERLGMEILDRMRTLKDLRFD